MAEFCLDCYNELHGTCYGEGAVELDYDICEGCGEWKPTIVSFRSWTEPVFEYSTRDQYRETTVFHELKALIKLPNRKKSGIIALSKRKRRS